MLFGNAHIKKTIAMRGAKGGQTGAVWHGGSDAHHAGVLAGNAAQGLAEDFGIGWRRGPGWFCLAAFDIKGPNSMVAARIPLCMLVALALGGDYMHQHRAVVMVAHIAQGSDEVF